MQANLQVSQTCENTDYFTRAGVNVTFLTFACEGVLIQTCGYVKCSCINLQSAHRIAETFEGENFREFHGFVAVCESFLCEIWGRGILWGSTSEQSAKVFSMKIIFFTNS